jgi:hypothetical protein
VSRPFAPAWAATTVVLVAFAGAAIGAIARPPPSNPHTADAVIAIQLDLPAPSNEPVLQRARWRKAAEALRLPQVVSRTATIVNLPESAVSSEGRLTARGRPEAGLFVIRARGATTDEARRLVSAATEATIEFLRLSTGTTGAARTAFDFESGAQGWGVGRSAFVLPPASTRPVRGGAFAGRGLLRTRCPDAREGCGTWVTVHRTFSPGIVYTATAWVRAVAGRVPLRLALGSSPEDVADGPTASASQGWTKIAVKWTPRALVGAAEVDVQVNGPGPATFDVDQASVRGPRGRYPTPRAFDVPGRYVVVGQPQSSGKLRAPTVTSALVGAAIGLAAALGGLAFGWFARRRR